MITPAQLAAEATEPALTEEQVMLLENLVQQYGPYEAMPGRWPNLSTILETERVTPTVRTKLLKAVLTALDALPPIVAESSGTDKAPSYFSVKTNWDALAKDVLNGLYKGQQDTGRSRFVLVQRRYNDIRLCENTIVRDNSILRRN